MKRITFTVASTAARWWVVIEDPGYRFEKPQATFARDLAEGIVHAIVYYVRGAAGSTFQLIGVDESGMEVVAVDSTLDDGGFDYGHEEFTP